MQVPGQNTSTISKARPVIVLAEAAHPASHREDLQAMAKRRFQNPQPEKLGRAWYIRIWEDVYIGGVRTRRRKRIKLADVSKGLREVQKLAADKLRRLNSGLVQVGAGVNFMHYVGARETCSFLRKPPRQQASSLSREQEV